MLITPEAIKKQSQQLAKLERQLARLKTKRRNEETRHKILLGSLVVKVKLHQLPLDDFYNGLLEIKKKLENEPELINLYQYKGESIFMGYQSLQKVNIEEGISPIPTLDSLKYLRQQTRRKIQFGGLIIKANLPLTTKAQVLGALISLREGGRMKINGGQSVIDN